jgi:hypothetical protein
MIAHCATTRPILCFLLVVVVSLSGGCGENLLRYELQNIATSPIFHQKVGAGHFSHHHPITKCLGLIQLGSSPS